MIPSFREATGAEAFCVPTPPGNSLPLLNFSACSDHQEPRERQAIVKRKKARHTLDNKHYKHIKCHLHVRNVNEKKKKKRNASVHESGLRGAVAAAQQGSLF